jgi:cell division septal protein FtsQ
MKRPNPYRKPTPEEEERARKNLAENPPSKKDIWAMIIAFLITALPIILLILGVFVLFIWLIFLKGN